MNPVVLDRRAEAELERAARWYKKQAGVDVAVRFAEEADVVIERVRRQPQLFPAVHRTKSGFDVRQGHFERFPYAIVFAVMSDHVRVVAIAHHRRRAKYWAYRLRKP